MEAPKNKSRNVWIAVGVVAGLCLIACVVGILVIRQFGSKLINTNPADAQAVSDKIAQYDMPPGYRAEMSMSFIVYDVVMLAPSQPGSNSMMIMLMQFNDSQSMNRDQMEQQMRQVFQQQGGQPGLQMKVVETRQDTIRGEPVTITVSEGTTQGITFRQWVTVFTGNKGPTVLMIQGSANDWNEDLILNFIHSIR